jgi:RimJ/RimL family protein N-acetyltransferase
VVTDVSRARHTPDVAFREHRSDRVVIRRFRVEDAASLAAYRSDPAVARYQSLDIPFSHEQARSFIERLEPANPDSPGEWFQFAVVESDRRAHRRRGCRCGR